MDTKNQPITTILIAVEVETSDAAEAMRQANCFINRGTSYPVKQSRLVRGGKVIAVNPE